MESLEVAYKNRSVFLTGHTGFKGSWMALWLQQLGADVTGYSLAPNTSPNHWDALGLEMASHFADIRDFDTLLIAMKKSAPEIVFHFAAQPLVGRSYKEPLETWSTNVMGTANVLQACQAINSVKAIVIVTTDKVYQNKNQTAGYKEDDCLGGHDPYSASKAACELVVSSYRNLPNSPLVASARAGNVIGGGDWSQGRLIPDLMRSVEQNIPLVLRAAHSTRPWQHVLDCLYGYLLLGEKLLKEDTSFAESWNFGPKDSCTVLDLVQTLKKNHPKLQWQNIPQKSYHEANMLSLNSEKSVKRLDWTPVWDTAKALTYTAQWYQKWNQEQIAISLEQLNGYNATRLKNHQLCNS